MSDTVLGAIFLASALPVAYFLWVGRGLGEAVGYLLFPVLWGALFLNGIFIDRLGIWIGLGLNVAFLIYLLWPVYDDAETEEGEPERTGSVVGFIVSIANGLQGVGVLIGVALVGAVVVGIGAGIVGGFGDGDKREGGHGGALSGTGQACDPSYPEDCLKANAIDYDCAGGTGGGPKYVSGPVTVRGSDPFELDRDGNGSACDF